MPTRTLTFEGLADQEDVHEYYNGGLGGSGSGPGPAYGISFGDKSLAIIESGAGGTGNVENAPSASTVLYFLFGVGAVMNVPAGFVGSLSLYYSSSYISDSGVFIYDGLDGTGTLLTTVVLSAAATPTYGCGVQPYSCWALATGSFAGTAKSAVFTGPANFVAFDNITLTIPDASKGQVTVQKVLAPESNLDPVFAFTASGGLSPSSFTCTPSAPYTFTNVDPGTYGIAEVGADGYDAVSLTSSVGTPASFTVGAGETVTITATNTPSQSPPNIDGIGERRLIRRMRRSPHIANQGRWSFIANFELWMDTGIGLNASLGQGSDPLVALRVSKDGGKTWGPSRPMSAGKLGEYRRRAIWWQLGRARDWVFEVTCSDPVAWAFVQAYIEIAPGTA